MTEQLQQRPDEWLMEEMIAGANRLFEHLMDINTEYHEMLLRDSTNPTSPEISSKLQDLLKLWLETYQGITGFVSENSLTRLSGGKKFLNYLRETRAMLAPSNRMGGEITRMRDAAIEEHKAGQTDDLLVLTDATLHSPV